MKTPSYHPDDRAFLIRRLHALGWLTATHAEDLIRNVEQFTDDVLADAVRVYQKFHGLEDDGWVGPQTHRSLQAVRFCAHPDAMPLQGDIAEWVDGKICWAITGRLPHVSEGDQADAFSIAWGRWAAVCGLRPQYVTDPAQADVLMTVGQIDGPGGTLAYSEIPLPGQAHGSRQLTVKFDQDETWEIVPYGITHGSAYDLVRVACHEIAHALGIPHLTFGNLMAPVYSFTIVEPQADDRREAQARYFPVSW